MSSFKTSILPLPEIDDHNLSYSFKHQSRSTQKNPKPPKLSKISLKGETSFNRSLFASGGCCPGGVGTNNAGNSLTVHGISFRDYSGIEEPLLSPIYNLNNRQQTYFEQCFEEILKIGEGSFGEVFRVKSREDGKFYAIKKSKEYFRGEFNRQVSDPIIQRSFKVSNS